MRYLQHDPFLIVVVRLFGLKNSSIINKMGVKRLYYRIWIRDVFWLAPGTKGAGVR